jgi:uncharacterized protein DUF1579
MKRLFLTFCSAILLLAACNNDSKTDEKTASESSADSSKMKMDSKDEAKTDDNSYTMPDSATSNKNWMEYGTPGDVHKMLAKSNGAWASEITMWDKPGGPSMTAKGTMTNKMIMGGRYQLSTFTGDMMGMPFEGMSTVAYDNLQKVFISTWIDNMGTGLATFRGTWDDATKSIDFKGKMVDAAAGKALDYREVFKIIDDNTQIMEMYKPAPDGKEFKTMEAKYTRKK